MEQEYFLITEPSNRLIIKESKNGKKLYYLKDLFDNKPKLKRVSKSIMNTNRFTFYSRNTFYPLSILEKYSLEEFKERYQEYTRKLDPYFYEEENANPPERLMNMQAVYQKLYFLKRKVSND